MRPVGVFLTERFFIFYGVLQLFGVVGVSYPVFLWIYFVGLSVITIFLLRDRKTASLRLREIAFVVPENLMLFETKEIKISALLGEEGDSQNSWSRPSAWAELPPSRCFRSHQEKAELTFSVTEEKTPALNGVFQITGRLLGRETIDHIFVFTRSRLGFWMCVSRHKAGPATLQVTPRLRRMSEQEFAEISRQNRLFIGQRSKMRGHSADQYYSSRKFQYPDSLRYIDQKRTAKFSEIMTKSFEELRNHHLIIGLDLGRTMSGEIGGSSKHDFYLSAALSLAKHALESRDSVDFFAFSQKVHMTVTRARSLAPFRVLVEDSKILEPRLEETNYSILPKMISSLTGQRSIVVLLTDLSRPSTQQSLLAALNPICRKHLVVAVGLIDNEFSLETQILNFRKQEMENSDISKIVYNYWLQEQLQLFQRRLSQIGGGSLNLSEENWLSVIERLYGGLRQSLFA